MAPRSENLKDAVLRDIKASVESLQKGRDVLQKALDGNEVGVCGHPGGGSIKGKTLYIISPMCSSTDAFQATL